MATKTPIKLVDLGSGQGALKEFEAGDTLPSAVLPTTDGITEGATNLYFTDARVRSTVLTGLSLATSTAVTAADTLLVALGKLQAQTTLRALKGANSDITSLSGLTTPLSAAQGGTGTSAGLAWGAITGTLSSQTDLQTALDAKSAFGVGQSWLDMTSSRALSTVYTNSTGKPIAITGVLGPASGATVTALTTVGSLAIYSTYSGVVNNYLSFSVVIPPGATYSVVAANGTAALVNWRELR